MLLINYCYYMLEFYSELVLEMEAKVKNKPYKNNLLKLQFKVIMFLKTWDNNLNEINWSNVKIINYLWLLIKIQYKLKVSFNLSYYYFKQKLFLL